MSRQVDKLVYGITQQVIGPQWFVPILEQQFLEISECQKLILFVFGAEQRLDIALENHLELEQELLRSSLSEMLYFDTTWRSLTDRRLAIGRRIANVLSACGIYGNQLREPKLPKIDEKVRTSKSEQTRASLDYRLGRQLRNFVTHNDLDAYNITWISGRDDDQDPPQSAYSTQVSLSADSLIRHIRNDSALIEYLSQSGAKLDLLSAIRRHVQSVGQLHEKVREALEADFKAAVKVLGGALDQGSQHKAKWVHAVARGPDGRTAQRLTISPEPLEYIDALRRKNSVFARFSQRYVTGRSMETRNP